MMAENKEKNILDELVRVALKQGENDLTAYEVYELGEIIHTLQQLSEVKQSLVIKTLEALK